MRDGARIAAAVGVLEEIETRHKPVRMALKNWGEGARYAGAKDRAFVSGLVLDALRRRRSLGWQVGDDSPRGVILGVLALVWHWPLDRLAEAAAGEPHGPGALSSAETAGLANPRALDDAPPAVLGDYPDWLDSPFERAFGEARAAQTAALSTRAPVDLRVNTLKTDRTRVSKALESLGAAPAKLLINAIRVPAPDAAERAPAVESAPEFAKGWFEVQDLGSQIAAAAAGAIKGRQVLDLCAGGGGKTLALAAAMGNSGQLYAYDSEARRLADTVTRSQRAPGCATCRSARPCARTPWMASKPVWIWSSSMRPAQARAHGAATPDAKWRLTPAQLERRIVEQDQVLGQAVAFVKLGGRLIYVTCSLLAEENEDRIAALLALHPDFNVVPTLDAIAASDQLEPAALVSLSTHATPAGFLRLTPATTATDGFFVAVLERAA